MQQQVERALDLNQEAVLCMEQGKFEHGRLLASRAVAIFLEKRQPQQEQHLDRNKRRYMYPLVRPIAVPPAARERSDEEVSPNNPFSIFDYAFAMDYGSSSSSLFEDGEKNNQEEDQRLDDTGATTRRKNQEEERLEGEQVQENHVGGNDDHMDDDCTVVCSSSSDPPHPNPALIEMEVSTVLLFNLALAYHKLGLSLDAGRPQARHCLARAAYLYHLCGSTRRWFEDEQEEWHLCQVPDYVIVRLALIANAGHIMAHLECDSETGLYKNLLEASLCSSVIKILPLDVQEFFCILWTAQASQIWGQFAPAA